MKLWAKILVGFISFSGFVILCVVFYGFYSSSAVEVMKSRTQARIQMREAKAILSGINQVQTLFRARHGSYTSDLKLLGYQPSLPLAYKFGFVEAYDSTALRKRMNEMDYDPNRKDSDVLWSDRYVESADHREVSVKDMAEFFCPRCHVDSNSYMAIAFANLDEDEAWDVWTIDEGGNLRHVMNDLEVE